MKKLPSVSGAMLVFIRFCVDVCQKSDNRYCQHLSSPTTHDYRMSRVLHSIFQLFGIELCFLRITHTQYVRCSCFSDKFEIFCHLLQELRKQEVFSFHLQFMISIEKAVHTSTILQQVGRSIFCSCCIFEACELVQEYFAHLKRSLLNWNLALNLGRSSHL